MLLELWLCQIVCALAPEAGVGTTPERLHPLVKTAQQKDLRRFWKKLYKFCKKPERANHIRTIRALQAARFWNEQAHEESYELIILRSDLERTVKSELKLLATEASRGASQERRALDRNDVLKAIDVNPDTVGENVTLASWLERQLKDEEYEHLESAVELLRQTTRRLVDYEEKEGSILERVRGLKGKGPPRRRVGFFVNDTEEFCPRISDVKWVASLVHEGKPVMVKLGGYMAAD